MAIVAEPTYMYIVRNYRKTKAGSGGRSTRIVYSFEHCEPLDRKHTDRVFPSSACEPLDQKHTDCVFL